MSSIRELIMEMRGVLDIDEAAKKVPREKAAPGFQYSTEGDFTEDEMKKVLSARDTWKDITRKGEDLLQRFKDVSDATEDLGKEEDSPERLYRAIVNLHHKCLAAKTTGDAMYGLFVAGRENMYQLANAWNISTKTRGTEGPRTPSTNVKPQGGNEIIRSLMRQGKHLVPSLKTLLDDASLAHSWLTKHHKAGGASKHDREALIDAAIQFRDGWSSVMFRNLMGITKRTTELMNRETAKRTQEGAEPPVLAVCPEFAWEHDDEYLAYLYD